MFTVGPYSISTIVMGTFRLDGGAMFGSVPRNLWEKRISPDTENCIPLAARCLLIRGADRNILVDVGPGDKWDEKRKQIFNIHNLPVKDYPFVPEDITDVVLTHLHFDHAGGVSEFSSNGEAILRYPAARHYVQKSNLENARTPSLKERASYLKENIAPLSAAELIEVEGNTEIIDGISVHQINGHTIGQQWVKITDGKQTIAFPTDLIPTSHHLPLPFTMGYDMCAATVLEEKNEFLTRAVEEDWIVVFEHDPEVSAAKITTDERGTFVVKERFDF